QPSDLGAPGGVRPEPVRPRLLQVRRQRLRIRVNEGEGMSLTTTAERARDTDPSGADSQRKSVIQGRASVWAWRIGLLIFALCVWQLAYHLRVSSRAVLPSPRAVWDATLSLQRSGQLWSNLWSTLGAALEALVLAALVGIPLGILLGMLPRTWRVFSP